MNMKRLFLLLTVVLLGQWAAAQTKIDYSVYDDKFNIYVANDLGRNWVLRPKAHRRTDGYNG